MGEGLIQILYYNKLKYEVIQPNIYMARHFRLLSNVYEYAGKNFINDLKYWKFVKNDAARLVILAWIARDSFSRHDI